METFMTFGEVEIKALWLLITKIGFSHSFH